MNFLNLDIGIFLVRLGFLFGNQSIQVAQCPAGQHYFFPFFLEDFEPKIVQALHIFITPKHFWIYDELRVIFSPSIPQDEPLTLRL